jgi:copper chaperone CopZ
MRWKKWFVGGAAVAGLATAGAFVPLITSEPVAADQATKTATCTLRIDGMVCAGCAVAVKMAAEKVDGVIHVDVSLEEKRAHVIYDPARTTPSVIAKAITAGSGFEADPQTTTPN